MTKEHANNQVSNILILKYLVNYALTFSGSKATSHAIAFAMAICNETQPEELQFDEQLIRPHLKSCLLDGKRMQNQKGGTGGVLHLQTAGVWEHDLL